MSTDAVNLSDQERQFLINLLETALGESRVELRHTHFSPEYRDVVKNDENLLRGILDKFRQKAGQ